MVDKVAQSSIKAML
ncbi:hypothetical protein IGP33_07900 [Escherichia coli]|nr:hypothetical protein [Escherichia coli]